MNSYSSTFGMVMDPRQADTGLQAATSSQWLATVFQSIRRQLPKEVKSHHQYDTPNLADHQYAL